jgi:hypothetical protein
MALTHGNALRDPQIPLDAKTQVWRNVPRRPFVESVLVPPKNEK